MLDARDVPTLAAQYGTGAAPLVVARYLSSRSRAALELDGPLLDLCDPGVRHDVEQHHAQSLVAVGLDHLDLSEITTGLRYLTQVIAADAHDRLGIAAIQFPSRLDGGACAPTGTSRSSLVSCLGDRATVSRKAVGTAPSARRRAVGGSSCAGAEDRS